LFYGEQIRLSIPEELTMARHNIKQILSVAQSGSPTSRIIHALSKHGGMSAAQIARQTGLARSTISTAVGELKASRIVVEREKEESEKGGAGRPGILLTLNPQAGTCMGVHLAYDGLQIVVADMSHSIIAEESVKLGVDYTPQEAVAAVRTAYAGLYQPSGLADAKLLGVGVSVSGPVQPDGVLQRGGILPKWVGVNIQTLFGGLFNRAVLVDNESNCAALAEMKWGAARGFQDFALFKMDVGVGGAIVCNGAVVRGAAGAAGEFGHVSINPEGELCRCGNRGCLELYASFLKPLEQLSRVHKKSMTMDDAIALAESGDAGALRMITDVADYGGRGLAMIGTIMNPPLILVGGRLALAGDLLLKPMTTAFQRHTLIKTVDVNMTARCDIRIGKFTENDSLLGAVALVLDNPHLAARAS
jgi:predicted NBD/HSP70 family sugar kinase/predicted transcriptional regulator